MNEVPGSPKDAAVEFRVLTPDDFEEYFHLRGRSLEETPQAFATDAEEWHNAQTETLEAHLTSGLPIVGAWSGSRLVGLLGMSREKKRSVSHKGGLWGWFVLPEFRNRGIGSELLARTTEIARREGIRQLRAVVWTGSGPALSILKQAGFETYGLERDARLVGGAFHDQAYLMAFLR